MNSWRSWSQKKPRLSLITEARKLHLDWLQRVLKRNQKRLRKSEASIPPRQGEGQDRGKSVILRYIISDIIISYKVPSQSQQK